MRGAGRAAPLRGREGRRVRAAVPAAIALAPLALVAWWWWRPVDAAGELRARGSALAGVGREAASGLGARLERWRMFTAGGDTVSGLWRPGARAPVAAGGAEAIASVEADDPAAGGEWVVVLLGGIGTDDRAALLVPDSLPVSVLAVSWPWKGPRRMRTAEFLARVPAMREALLATPAALATGVAAARRERPGARVALLGASLGAAPTAAAASFAGADALVLVDGAADLGTLMRSEVRRAMPGVAGAALAPAAGALGARLLAPLEPARHGPAARALPVLVVDAEREERYPRACVERLHAAYPHAARATHPGTHLRPEHREEVEAIVVAAWRWLQSLPRR